jgi:hypothetical protein
MLLNIGTVKSAISGPGYPEISVNWEIDKEPHYISLLH